MLKINTASIPRSEKILRRATCLPTDAIGMCVSVSGPVVGNLYSVSLTDIHTDLADACVAMIVAKETATVCRIQFLGPIRGVYTALVPGRRYFVGSDSLLTDMPPDPPVGGLAYVQIVATAIDSGELLFNPQTPIKRIG